MVTVGSILRGTFQFARDNILAILVWSALTLAAGLVMALTMMRPIYAAQLAALQTGGNALPSFGPAFWLLAGVMVILLLVLWAAVFRAVLLPIESRFFYLRLGMDEARLLGLLLLMILAAIVLEIVAVLAIILIGTVLSLVLGKVGGMLIGGLVALILFGAGIWAIVRIAPAGPLTILERKIMIGPAWRLSRGRFWPMFGAFLVIMLATWAVYMLLMFVQMGPIMADLVRPGDPEAAQRIVQWQAAQFQPGARMMIYAVISSLIYGVSLALQVGMTAVATRELLKDAEAAPHPGPWG